MPLKKLINFTLDIEFFFQGKNRTAFSKKIGSKKHGRAEVHGGSASTIHVWTGTIWAFLSQESTVHFTIGVDGGALRPIPPRVCFIDFFN